VVAYAMGRHEGMDTSTPGDRSTPDPSEFDGGQPPAADDDGPDVLLPDTLAPHRHEEALPGADEGDVVEQHLDAVPPGDDEDERRQ
jgi:hypothetical protein